MKKKLIMLPTLALLTLVAASCGETKPTSSKEDPDSCVKAKEDDKVHLIVLVGQSGARGKALNAHLPEEYKADNLDVDIIADGLSMPSLNNIPDSPDSLAMFSPIAPGYGDDKTENGPEIGMGLAMASRYQKIDGNMKSGIVKYSACGSTFIADWFSESMLESDNIADKLDIRQIKVNPKTGNDVGPLTNNLYQLIDAAIEQVESDGLEAVVDGVVWSHGEQDTKFDVNMSIYEEALTTFISDVRAYIGNDKLPFVIGGAMTNAGKYTNELRAIQERVASKDPYASFVSTQDLGPNRFEPWHLSAEGNIIFGQRAVDEILRLNDTRVIESFEPSAVDVPKGVKVALPQYQTANFSNDHSVLVKVDKYADYDPNKEGAQEVEYEVTRNCVTTKGKITVNVNSNNAYVDGVISSNEYSKATDIGEAGKLYVKKTDKGLYVAADIKDTDVFTDGEDWSRGDMGQRGTNDDFRIFLTDGDANTAKTVAISSDNILRVYTDGLSINSATDSELLANNKYFNRQYNDLQTRVVTKGLMNTGESEGFVVETYIPFATLGYSASSDLKMCVEYSDIATGSPRKDNKIYVGGSSTLENPELDNASYLDIASYLA